MKATILKAEHIEKMTETKNIYFSAKSNRLS